MSDTKLQEEAMEETIAPILTRIVEAEEWLERAGGLTFTKYGLGAWSPSKIKMLEKCPLQFLLKYILKVRPDDDYIQDTSMADVGTTGHRILEHVVQGKSLDEAYALTKKEMCNIDPEDRKKGGCYLTEDQWINDILPIENSIIAFKERLDNFERNTPVKRKLTELKLGVTKDWKPTTFFAKDVYFRGIIDLVIEIDQGPGFLPDALIIDHKSGGGDFSTSTRNYQQQLDAYKPLYHFGYQKTSGITAGINFIRAGTAGYDEYADKEEIENKLVKKVEWIIQGAVDTTIERGFFKHVRGSHCQYCEFDIPCKAKVLKDFELSTKKYFSIKEVK